MIPENVSYFIDPGLLLKQSEEIDYKISDFS